MPPPFDVADGLLRERGYQQVTPPFHMVLPVVLDNPAAKKILDQAARLAHREGLDQRLGDVLVTRAVALHELGRRTEARRDLARAESLVLDERRPEINLQRALLEHNGGRVMAAAALYHRVLADPLSPADVWIKAANNLSVAYTELGKPRDALQVLERAAALARGAEPAPGGHHHQQPGVVQLPRR